MADDLDSDLGRRLVAAIDEGLGTVPGLRAAHARGICCDATFTPTPEAAAMCSAPHFQAPAPAVVRFSNASPRPDASDHRQAVGGMAVKFLLGDGRETDLVAISIPVFFVREPEDFIPFTLARKADPKTGKPSSTGVLRYGLRHPEAWRAILHAARHQRSVMASRLEARYFGIHAFRWTTPGGAQSAIRYELEPEAGEREIPRSGAKARGRELLTDELVARLAKGPAGFRLVVQVAEAGDRTDDPTRPWPKSRRRVVAGRLEITGVAADQDAGCEQRAFDPTRVVAGIDLSDDRVLAARRAAYSVSIERRLAQRGR
ncbi:MAG: catalase family peroxidase [Chloroflexota bacterium]